VVLGVSRDFSGGRRALDDVSLTVAPGELHALLGPNGAGKTTLLRIMSGLTTPSSGRVQVLGHDTSAFREVRREVGLVPAGDRTFYLRISGLENLLFFGRLQGLRRRAAVERAHELLERVGLAAAAGTRVGEYSTGMQKRLSIARALFPGPRVLLVDEATHDLDPSGASEIRDLVGELAAGGAAVLWATQRVEEVQGFAQRVTLLQGGRVRFAGSVAELVSRGSTGRFLVRLRAPGERVPSPTRLAAAVAGFGTITSAAEGSSDDFLLVLRDPAQLGAALARLLAVPVDVVSCRHELPAVEQAFLTLTREQP